ncbi:peptidylprolyl isomerase [Kibdelosporangium philippinense]|uniref:Peptidylprolyl isomerase n=1 Tax=Kibdelosporangium philippinense TaxID=211113 RepID=A0ABS8ZA57_9PSEU|nr:peptidylprolyl isomerase [Kibdelosporangium philippinense]MCE7002727.1 peptidylprolyl isomerase [Kibdelosporangium philippinense]
MAARKPLIIAAAVLLVVAAVAIWVRWPSPVTGIAVGAPSSELPGANCTYRPDPIGTKTKDVGKPDGSRTRTTGTVPLTLKTTQGDIGITLDRAQAPCAVQSMLFLAQKKFYDDTPCHRLTLSPTLSVLQCGDPKGEGRGGPGYMFDSEYPVGLPQAEEQGLWIYPAGTVAMANRGRDTNGSQFFMVYADATLPREYPVIGTFDATGKATIEKIAAAGVIPSDYGGDQDGQPKLPVTITEAIGGK